MDAPYESAGGHVPDTRRIDFFREELVELARAIADGANVLAFHAWSLLDNFEWAGGYPAFTVLPMWTSVTKNAP
jgi:beta-glucosidase